MLQKTLCILSVVLTLSSTAVSTSTLQTSRKFPDGFQFGAATAAFQVEGAWNADGKSENIWDRLIHTDPCAITNCSNADVATNSYNLYKRDVEMMTELGLDYYRFSLSWGRILPNGFADKVNEAGVAHYNDLIDEMQRHNIDPMVTLYHWDLPQKLQDLGGWTNPLIVDWYADYVRVAFEKFGDKVKLWITVNEPDQICLEGYGTGVNAPRVNFSGVGEYLCAKHLLLAHAKAWHIYNDEFRPSQEGSIGITIHAAWSGPESDTEANIKAAEDYMQFQWGQYANPIFSDNGNFPQVMIDNIAAKSAAQGFPRSRLPVFSNEELQYILGTSDFFGLNHYTSSVSFFNESVYGMFSQPSFNDDIGAGNYRDPTLPSAASTWIKVYPEGFYNILLKIKNDFNNPIVVVTENGFSTLGGLNDEDRVDYYRSYLDAMLSAIDDGCNVRKYTAWSLMDNFEWTSGYHTRFGLYEVDFESPQLTRTARASAYVYREILRTRTLDHTYTPNITENMTNED